MEHNKSYLLVILLSFSLLHSCGLKSYNYPYAENNTTVDTLYDIEVTDEYQWLESDSDQTRENWLNEQMALTTNYFDKSPIKESLEKRISELSSTPRFFMIELLNDTLYYYKQGMNQDSLSLYKMHAEDLIPIRIDSYKNSSVQEEQITTTAISGDGKYLAIPQQSTTNNKYIIRIHSLSANKPLYDSTEAIAYNLKPIWVNDGFYYIGSTKQSNENNVYFYNLRKKKSTIVFKGSGIINNNLNVILANEKLFISELSQIEDRLDIYSLDLNSKKNEPNQIAKLYLKDRNASIKGADEKYIYLFRTVNNQSQLLGYNLADKKWQILYTTDYPAATINILKDEIIFTLQSLKKHEGILIHKDDWKAHALTIPTSGRSELITERNGCKAFILNESLIMPHTLYSVSLDSTNETYPITSLIDLKFNPSDFESEYISVPDKNGNNMDIVLCYKKGMIRNGKNPLLFFDFSTGYNLFANRFNYSRIALLEQGFIFAHKRLDSPNSSVYLEDKANEISCILNYLFKNKYTNKENLCLSGREFGATAIAHLLNTNPEICRVALLNRGVYDLIRHRDLDQMIFPLDSAYHITNKSNLEKTLKVSPIHNINKKHIYPAIAINTGANDVNISPTHSYKYLAQLQMHTPNKNLILLLLKEKSIAESEFKCSEYNDELLFNYAFLIDNMNIKYSESNFSN